MIRLLVQAGCSRDYVGQVIHAILKTAGISVYGSVSRRTVSRVIVEGYYAAQVQLGYEMTKAKRRFNISISCFSNLTSSLLDMTFSADGTTHRSINYNA